MKTHFKRPFQVLAIPFIVLFLLILITTASSVVASGSDPPAADPHLSRGDEALSQDVLRVEGFRPQNAIDLPVVALPTPAMDPCLHCHVTGEETGIWTPLSRWVLFGSFGAILGLGLFRSASVWVTRLPWKPLRIRASEYIDTRYQIAEPLAKALSKPVPTFALKWWYCLGGITALLFAVQAVTGILLAFYYKPTPAEAYASIQYIETEVRFGAGIRAIHHWAANGMIVMCIAHMLRVFVMGAYKAPRELNWVSGAVLLALTLIFGFTGYLLPWDQRAFWATTVGTDIVGGMPVIGEVLLVFMRVGWDVAAQTLSRFYLLHIAVLPIATVALMGAHFLMVRRQGVARPL